jgi:hypothetical protein
MKLQLLAMAVFLFSSTTAANSFRRHRRTLSANAKNQPHWLAASPSDSNISPLLALFSSPPGFNPPFLSKTSSLKLQVASNPA